MLDKTAKPVSGSTEGSLQEDRPGDQHEQIAQRPLNCTQTQKNGRAVEKVRGGESANHTDFENHEIKSINKGVKRNSKGRVLGHQNIFLNNVDEWMDVGAREAFHSFRNYLLKDLTKQKKKVEQNRRIAEMMEKMDAETFFAIVSSTKSIVQFADQTKLVLLINLQVEVAPEVISRWISTTSGRSYLVDVMEVTKEYMNKRLSEEEFLTKARKMLSIAIESDYNVCEDAGPDKKKKQHLLTRLIVQDDLLKTINKSRAAMDKENIAIDSNQKKLNELFRRDKSKTSNGVAQEQLKATIQDEKNKVEKHRTHIINLQKEFLDNVEKWMTLKAKSAFRKFREKTLENRGRYTELAQHDRLIQVVKYMDVEKFFKAVTITQSTVELTGGDRLNLLINGQLDVHPRAVHQMTNNHNQMTNNNNLETAMILTKRLRKKEIFVHHFQTEIKTCLKDYKMITRAEIEDMLQWMEDSQEKRIQIDKNDSKRIKIALEKNERERAKAAATINDLRNHLKDISPVEAHRLRTTLGAEKGYKTRRMLELALKMATCYNDASIPAIADWVEIVKLEFEEFKLGLLEHEKAEPHRRFYETMLDSDSSENFNRMMSTCIEGILEIQATANEENWSSSLSAYYHVRKHASLSGKYFDRIGKACTTNDKTDAYLIEQKDYILQDRFKKHTYISQDATYCWSVYVDLNNYNGIQKWTYNHEDETSINPTVASHFHIAKSR